MSPELWSVVLGFIATFVVTIFKQTGFRREINFLIALAVSLVLGVANVYFTNGTLTNLWSSSALIFATAATVYELIWSKYEGKVAQLTSRWKRPVV